MNKLTFTGQGDCRAGLYETLEEQHPGFYVSRHLADGTIEMTRRPSANDDIKLLLKLLVKKGLITKEEIEQEKQELQWT